MFTQFNDDFESESGSDSETEFEPPTPDVQLLQAAQQCNLEKIRALFAAQPKPNVNAKDPETGRTALHLVANHSAKDEKESKKVFDILVTEFKADFNAQDEEGCTPADLLANPHEFDFRGSPRSPFQVNFFKFIIYFIGEMNAKLAAAKIPKIFVLVNTTQEMIDFAKAHPEYEQIGFLVKTPKSRKKPTDRHLSPILFDKKNQSFVQLDSIARFYPTPKCPGMKFYYSPFKRQVSGDGCDAEALLLLYKIMRHYPEFLEFCQSHSQKDERILPPFTEQEVKRFDELETKLDRERDRTLYYRMTKPEKDELTLLNMRFFTQRQMKANLCVDDDKLVPGSLLADIYRLTQWPIKLVTHVERSDLVQYPVESEAKQAEIARPDFKKRKENWDLARNLKYRLVYGWLQPKLAKAGDKQKLEISDSIASYVTGVSKRKL